MVEIKFIAIEDPYSEEVFLLLKSGLYPYVEQIFGWNDDFQRQRIKDDYQRDWFHWVYAGESKLGLVCYKRYQGGLHLHLIIIAQHYSRQGVGTKIMNKFTELARREQRSISLSCFKCNLPGVALYRSLGYQVTAEEEHFLLFKLTP